MPQKRVLYVFDHVALQSIILKDQQYYEESSFTISYVHLLPDLLPALLNQAIMISG